MRTLEPVGVPMDGFPEKVVKICGQRNGLMGLEVLDTWRGQGKNLYVDPTFVHGVYALVPNISEASRDRGCVERKTDILPCGGGLPSITHEL